MSFGLISVSLVQEDNTVGSRGVLSQRQKEILIGTLLGDAHLEPNGKYVRVRIDHYDRHKEYVFWMANELLPFSLKPREIIEDDKRSGKSYTRWHFSSQSLPVFQGFRDLFYFRGRKIVPENLDKLITPLSLAIWYMDDGFRRRDCKGFYLCTSSFTNREQKILQKVLWIRFGLEVSIHHQRKLERIYIPAAHAEKFNDLIKPFILSVFRYKLL